MVAGMAPAWWHKKVHNFIFYARSLFHVTCQPYNFAKICIQKAILFHFSGDAVLYGYLTVFILVGYLYGLSNKTECRSLEIYQL